ncbi:hypothetical protein AGABI2DRAFT_195701 [Agaricus bisporus var. bisporus H97]|uniref:hypothetical protein n=1 Tax=Agaricus bisporus var. bisporus (strain H97 / ATCC MYA-4626 / FGSC 10389) TaxID=936046 RepID=UPI00029F4EA9|nr:hypothetical protein AGABI2DRAFT_195701 [Agaricus bisporus var. bisporus H97]EKV42352.1 hypothetical protein AGABI2DRAFT_195701 [Agaricus bisporus var. bisporus H97]
MRLLPLLALPSLVAAQYFSAGWQPGQPLHETQSSPAPTYTPAPQPAKGLSELFSLNTLLTLPPVAGLFERFGINITERVALSRADLWDERIPLITDDNFNELIANEPLTEEEEEKRVWVVVISVTAAKQEGLSKYLDQVFDSAYNETLEKNDLPNIRWGRIDYLDVTYLTTKWNVWQAPYLAVITNRGKTLRFYRPHQIRLRDYALRDFLLTDGWQITPPWESRYAPGGDREWVLDLIATYLAKAYNYIVLVPRWALYILTGAIGSVILNFLHRPSKKRTPAKPPVKGGSTSAQSTTSTTEKSDEAAAVSAVQIKPEPTNVPSTPTTPRSTPRRNGKKGKGRQ